MKFWIVGVFCVFSGPYLVAQVAPVRQAAVRKDLSAATALRFVGPTAAPPVAHPAFESEYRFPLAITLSGTHYYRNGFKQTNEMRYYINPARSWMATCSGENDPSSPVTAGHHADAMAVYDFGHNTVLLLTPSRKSGLAMELTTAANTPNPFSGTAKMDENWKCHKTGRKRVILMMRCEECICVDAPRDVSSAMWVTFEMNTNMAPAGLRSPFAPQLRAAKKTGGVLVEGHFYESGELKSFVSMKEVNRNANYALSLEDYYVR